MVKKIFLAVFVYCIFVFLVFFSGSFSGLKFDAGRQASKTDDESSFFRREEITYDIKMGGLNLGKAVFRYLENTEINGRMLAKVSFETDMARFKDTETIYSDPRTFLPVKIDRDIVNWFNKEKITEDYDQENFRVTITKHGKGKDKLVIQRDNVIHNAILLPHYVRRINKLAPGYTFVVNLPNRKLQMKLVAQENIKANGKVYSAYHFESLPKQVDIWISADEDRIPLKMQGVGALGYLLVLRDYAFKPLKE